MIPFQRHTTSLKKLKYLRVNLIFYNRPILFDENPVKPYGLEALLLLIEKATCLILDFEICLERSWFIISVTLGWNSSKIH